MDQVKEWVEKEPNENTEFCILDCYRYLTKLRCYIALEECDRAWNLSNKLELYFTSYKRAYMSMENTLLRAIVAYRMNKPVWRELFQSALEKARERKFIWVIAREGIAIKPMIEALELHGDDDYMRRLLIKQKEMTCCYPRYLSRSHVLEEPMTDMENKILSLHAEGIQTDEILDILCITKRTLKFHNGNIYRKLHVKNKQEAVYAAKKLKVV
jgi:LuxR family maltose regulon positive regulatory protein